jgi:hypothetical protein
VTRGFEPSSERVAEERVVKHWLTVERHTAGNDSAGLDAMNSREALDGLLKRKPGAAAFLWRARPVEWYYTTLSRTEFERLRVIDGPTGLGWRALSPDDTVLGAAKRIEREDPAPLMTQTGVDIERVCRLADALAAGDELPALVLTKRRGSGPPRIADGNHRASAAALHLLQTGEYRPQRVYLGIGANPVLRPLRQRLYDLFRRLHRNGPRW